MSITVLDSTGATKTVETLPIQGAALAAASLPVAISTDQLSLLASALNQSSELTKLDQIHADLIAPTPAGSAIIGAVNLNGITVAANIGNDSVALSTTALQTLGFNYLFNGSTWSRSKLLSSNARLAASAATTNATFVRTSNVCLGLFTAYNTTATVRYIKLYNKASVATVGTDTPVHVIALAPNAATQVQWPNGGYFFPLGLSYAITGLAADSDTTAIAAGDIVCLNISYA